MTLETRQEEELLHRIRRIEHKLDALFVLCEQILSTDVEILDDVTPVYKPTTGITVENLTIR